ncbi:MAG: hypothetical protein WD449_03275 [Candidatus Babeliales bacterium]
MKKILLLGLLAVSMVQLPLNAGCDGDSCDKSEKSGRDCLFVFGSAGGSFSRCAGICVDTSGTGSWPIVPEGYASDLGRTGVVEFGIGYDWCDWLSLIASGQYRGDYNYCIAQTEIPLFVDVDMVVSTTGTRFFSLDNQAYMFSALFDLTKAFDCDDWGFGVVIGGGIGAAHHTVYDFHTVVEQKDVDGSRFVVDVATYIRNWSFAAQAVLGLEYTACNWLTLGAGYRYFYGGDFCTRDYISSSARRSNTIEVTPWQGSLQANEFYVYLYCDY